MFTICLKMGCNNLVKPPEKYCNQHKHIEEKKKKERNKFYDRYKRNSQAKAFYNSNEWKIARRFILNRDAHLCQECLKQGRITKADTVHHIIELNQDWSKRLEITNLESICRKCHNKHKRKG